MKILQVIATLDRGGAETLLVNILENIDRKQYQFDFLVFDDKQYDYEDKILALGGKIIRFPSPVSIGMLKFIKQLKKLIKEESYDVVHAHTLFNCGPVMLSAFLAKVKKRISHSHNTKILEEKISIKKRIYFILSKLLINLLSTDCLACGEEAGNFLYYRFRNFKIINNGIKIDKYQFNNSLREQLRYNYKISADALVIGNIGRLNFQKNQKFLIDIFEKIIIEYPNSFLVILGDGELKKELEDIIHQRHLEKHILLLGNLPNANEYYSMFDIFVFPSLFEGLPYTLIEAQCNGLPIIASSAISNQSNITNTIIFLDLNESTKVWKDVILKEQRKRYEDLDAISNSGYSIMNTTNIIVDLYSK